MVKVWWYAGRDKVWVKPQWFHYRKHIWGLYLFIGRLTILIRSKGA